MNYSVFLITPPIQVNILQIGQLSLHLSLLHMNIYNQILLCIRVDQIFVRLSFIGEITQNIVLLQLQIRKPAL